jgi:hypothetical protein
LFNEIKKYGKNIEDVLGETRMNHLKTFEKGFGLSDMLKSKDLTGKAVDLERNALNKGAMRMLQRSFSTHLMIKHGFVSKTYAYGIRAIQLIGGLKNDGYKKFMTKMMTDPKFFQDALEMTADIKTHEDIIRARLVLAHHFGIPTESMNEQEAQEQARNLMDVSIELENSVFGKGYSEEPTEETPEEPTVGQQEKDLGLIPATEPSTQNEVPEKHKEPVNNTLGLTKETLQTPAITNVPEIQPSDPTTSISTRKTMSEIRGD